MDNYNGNTYARQDTDMSVGAWIGTLILSAIPIVGFICLIVWAVSSSPEKRSRKNWAIAQFIMTLIGVVIAPFWCMPSRAALPWRICWS